MRPDVGADFPGRPRPALVGCIFNDFEQQARWMPEADVLGAEPFLDSAVLDLVMLEMRFPEVGRAGRDRVTGRRQLPGAGASRLAAVGEGGCNRPELDIGV